MLDPRTQDGENAMVPAIQASHNEAPPAGCLVIQRRWEAPRLLGVRATMAGKEWWTQSSKTSEASGLRPYRAGALGVALTQGGASLYPGLSHSAPLGLRRG